MRKVAITGSLASGKTTVCEIFKALGAYVISADAIVHQLLTPTSPVGQRVIDLFGADIVDAGEISREKIAKRAFSDPQLLEKLEKLLHPEVRTVIEATYTDISQAAYPLFVAEIPLLYEAGFEGDYDTVIVVRRERAHRPDPREQFQLPIEEKVARCDIVIENNGSLAQLRQTVEVTFNNLKGKNI